LGYGIGIWDGQDDEPLLSLQAGGDGLYPTGASGALQSNYGCLRSVLAVLLVVLGGAANGSSLGPSESPGSLGSLEAGQCSCKRSSAEQDYLLTNALRSPQPGGQSFG
jgi:hypothetical protein